MGSISEKDPKSNGIFEIKDPRNTISTLCSIFSSPVNFAYSGSNIWLFKPKSGSIISGAIFVISDPRYSNFDTRIPFHLKFWSWWYEWAPLERGNILLLGENFKILNKPNDNSKKQNYPTRWIWLGKIFRLRLITH